MGSRKTNDGKIEDFRNEPLVIRPNSTFKLIIYHFIQFIIQFARNGCSAAA